MSMSVELDESFDPPGGNHLVSYCKPAYRVRWLKNKGAILILFWNYLVLTTYYLFRAGYREKQLDNPFHVTDTGIILWCTGILFPIGGWLADTRIGRYRVIHYSMLLMWLGTILATFGELLLTNVVSSEHHAQILDGVYSCLCVFVAIGLGGFLSNIIHLGIDQLADASSTEITSFITWYIMTVFLSGFTVHYITDCVITSNTFYIKTFVVAICLTLAVSLDFLLQHILVREQVAGSSIRVILRVVKYSFKSGKSAHVQMDSDGVFSKLDVAKHIHGGPFTSQQVDNVRKFLKILIIIAIATIAYGSIPLLTYASERIEFHLHILHRENDISDCYKDLTVRYAYFFFIMVLIVLYEFLIHPLFYRCLPKVRITTKFLFAIVVFLLWILSLLTIQSVTYVRELNVSGNASKVCLIIKGTKLDNISIAYKWLLIPSFFEGLSFILILSSSLEFIWAQAPTSMKGLILGLGYLFVGVYTMIHTVLSAPFNFKGIARHIAWEHSPLSCEIWYFLMEAIITFIVLVSMIVAVKRYSKQRIETITENLYPTT